jgi:hypothetical protein
MEAPAHLELTHLHANGCIDYRYTTPGHNLKEVLSPKPETSYDWPYEEFINTSVGKQLHELWSKGMDKVATTSVGRLIGIYTHDEIRGYITIINW